MLPAAVGLTPPTRLRTLLPLYRYAALSPDGRSFLGVGRSLPIHSLFQVAPFVDKYLHQNYEGFYCFQHIHLTQHQ